MEKMTKDRLDKLVEQYPWWSEARLTLAREQGTAADERTRLVAMLHPTALIASKAIDIATLTHLTTDDLIDRFLKRGDYRIVAEDGDAEEIVTPNFEDEDDMVSEELAEIYLKQGLYSEAIETYHKLSLLNSEKSVYFAGLIEEVKGKLNKN